MDSNLRHLKDFLTLYNKVTEMCFSRCVDNLNGRVLARHEDVCVDRCVTKFAGFNQNMMAFYVDAQTTMSAKRMEEMKKKVRIAEQQKKERQREGQRLNELGSADNLWQPVHLAATVPDTRYPLPAELSRSRSKSRRLPGLRQFVKLS